MCSNWAYDLFLGRIIRRLGEEVVNLVGFDSSDSLLDVACGTGEQALVYAKRGIDVTGLDISKESVDWAVRKAQDQKHNNVRFICGDATNMPSSNGEFDYSSICLGLHAMSPLLRDKVLKEMKRVTKKGIIIVDYSLPEENVSIPKYTKSIIRMIERFATNKEHYANYLNFMEEEGLSSLTKKHELTVEKEKGIYGISVNKLSFND